MVEAWRDIPNYEGLYQVSDLGRVKSLERTVRCADGTRVLKERVLIGSVNGRGYLTVGFSKDSKTKTKAIHKLVAIAFHGHIPDGMELAVDHKDGNKLNNHKDNLRIVTQKVNVNNKHSKRYERTNFKNSKRP